MSPWQSPKLQIASTHFEMCRLSSPEVACYLSFSSGLLIFAGYIFSSLGIFLISRWYAKASISTSSGKLDMRFENEFPYTFSLFSLCPTFWILLLLNFCQLYQNSKNIKLDKIYLLLSVYDEVFCTVNNMNLKAENLEATLMTSWSCKSTWVQKYSVIGSGRRECSSMTQNLGSYRKLSQTLGSNKLCYCVPLIAQNFCIFAFPLYFHPNFLLQIFSLAFLIIFLFHSFLSFLHFSG